MSEQHCEELQVHHGGSVVGRREEEQQGLLELDVFQMVLMVVAVALLATSALYWLVICYSRSRQNSRARNYESAVRGWEGPEEEEEVVRRSSSFFNPMTFFSRSKTSRESCIFYIYSNPLPVGLREEQQEQQKQQLEQQIQELPEPPLFHMQLQGFDL